MIENVTETAPDRPRYRVGNHQPQNIYDGDTYVGVMFSAADSARVVAALNEAEARLSEWGYSALPPPSVGPGNPATPTGQ